MKDRSHTPASLKFLFILLSVGLFILPCATEETKDEASSRTGYASWYGGKFHGRTTASGEVFDKNKLTAAHRRLPFGTILEVTNLANDKSVTVRITDRGPFVEDRIIDLSRAAAEEIGLVRSGVAKVEIEVIESTGEQQELSGPGKEEAGNESTSHGEPGSVGLESEKLDTGKVYKDPRDNPLYTFPEPVSYTIQIASFSHEENAQRLYTLLQEEGFSPACEKSSSGHHRVVLPDVEPDKLEEVKQRLSELGHTSLLIREKL
ncbi:MAG: septal ring lytic transglycosylase RlpA family protein [Spirochaetia bacterium]